MENIFVEFLPPWVETGIQPAFYDKESGTVLQQTARMYARVNMLIRMFNKLSKNTKATVEEYINKFNELHDYVHDYFDNLDVQEEINNKLDQMAEDGVLTDIIAQYLTLAGILVYDTVQDLSEATNVAVGSKCMTYGYLRLGDGVYNIYYIREITNTDVVDGYNIVSIQSSNVLVAERLQYGKKVVIELLPTDDIQDYLDIEADKTIVLPYNTTYTVTDALMVNSDTVIDLNNSTIFFDYARPASFPVVNWDETLGFMGYKNNSSFTEYNGYSNITIKNGTIKGGCSCFLHNKNVKFSNVEFTELGSRHAMQFGGCYGVTIENCVFNGTLLQSGNEHSAECINIDPCNNGGQPFVAGTSAMFDHTANRDIVIKNNIFNKSTAVDQLYACAIGSHGADDNGHMICQRFTVTDNSLGEPYADAINITDYKDVNISNNTASFGSSHATYTYFIHGRGGLENVIASNNTVTGVGQFMYSDTSSRDRKNLLIEGNKIYTKDLAGYKAIQLFHYEDVYIQNNTIYNKYGAIHTDGLYSGSTFISDTESKNVNVNHNSIWIVDGGGGEIQLRFKYTIGVKIDGNTIQYTAVNNMAWANTIDFQDGTSDTMVMNNKTSDPKHFIDRSQVNDKFMYNNAQYALSGASGTSQSGTLNESLTKFTKLVLPIGDTTNTQYVEILPWTPLNRNKFYWGDDTSRTFRFAVVKSDDTVGYGKLVINNDNTFTYTGDVSLRGIYAYD